VPAGRRGARQPATDRGAVLAFEQRQMGVELARQIALGTAGT
jgi:hypothetical protein